MAPAFTSLTTMKEVQFEQEMVFEQEIAFEQEESTET